MASASPLPGIPILLPQLSVSFYTLGICTAKIGGTRCPQREEGVYQKVWNIHFFSCLIRGLTVMGFSPRMRQPDTPRSNGNISDTRLTNPSLHTQHKYPQAGLPPAVFDSPCSCTTHSLSLPCSVSLLATPVFVSTKTLFLPRPFTRISLINLALLPESRSSQRYVTMIPTSLFAIARFTHPFLLDPLIAVGNWEAGLCCTVVVAVLDTNCCE